MIDQNLLHAMMALGALLVALCSRVVMLSAKGGQKGK